MKTAKEFLIVSVFIQLLAAVTAKATDRLVLGEMFTNTS